jgi:hypothetical protein
MPKVKVIADTKVGVETVFVGDVVDVTEQEADALIALGKAEPSTAKVKKTDGEKTDGGKSA